MEVQAEIRFKAPFSRSFLAKIEANPEPACTNDHRWLLYGYFLRFHSKKPTREVNRPEAHDSKVPIFRKTLQILAFMRHFPKKIDGGRNWIRTSEGVSQQIYSLPPLATWVSYRPSFPRREAHLAKRNRACQPCGEIREARR